MSTTASYALAVKKLLSKIGRVNKTTQQLWGVSLAMPIYRKCYANNWHEIAQVSNKQPSGAVGTGGKSVYDKSEKPKGLSRSEWTVMTLSVHHANFTPKDNQKRKSNSALHPMPYFTA
ncbi:hypothetical protein [Nostoc sp. NOS(2021)]|uniref:hypothetical protein n=1 Tax=Nostoc sp. NOS(2021) TaxID=2815407 RepID=UPI0025D61123|nr:hypothetical protein [Nostoc sp. NOS(2021)]